MLLDQKVFVYLILTGIVVVFPRPLTAKDVLPLVVAQAPPPSPAEGEERTENKGKKSKQPGHSNQLNSKQSGAQQDRVQQPRADRTQQDQIQRRRKAEPSQLQGNEGNQRVRTRQDQPHDLQRQDREPERAKKQENAGRQGEDGARQGGPRERKPQNRDVERAKKQREDNREQQDRARQDRSQEQQRQDLGAERVKKRDEHGREWQDRSRQEQFDERDAARSQKPEVSRRDRQDRVRHNPAVEREVESIKNREDDRRPRDNDRQNYREERSEPGVADRNQPARDKDRFEYDRNGQRELDRAYRPDHDATRPSLETLRVQPWQSDRASRQQYHFRSEEIRESYRQAPSQQRSFDDLKGDRRERSISGGNLRVIDEPDRRIIVKQDNRTFIRHDESERFRRISPDARTVRRADGTSATFMTRRGVRIYDITDRNGRLLYRYRRYPEGREVVLIDNRRYYQRERNRSRDVFIGAGLGLAIGSTIALSAPEIRIPRDDYIVDYGRATDDDLYEALSAPPVERLDRGYSLEEVRYSMHLRDRMRRIDLDSVTFDFGSWEIGTEQGRALDRLAESINRVLTRNPDEIFMIEGHTDAVGSEEDNLTLSDRRAQSVAEVLTTEYGVTPENLVTQGYGEEHLKIPTDGPERANRRITVRRIGPLLSGRADDDRYSGGSRGNDRTYDNGRGPDGER